MLGLGEKIPLFGYPEISFQTYSKSEDKVQEMWQMVAKSMQFYFGLGVLCKQREGKGIYSFGMMFVLFYLKVFTPYKLM